MIEKRFTVHIKWFNYDKTEGEIELFDNGQPLLVSECIEDVQMVKDLLNELSEENMRLKGENAEYKLLLMSLQETAKRFFPNGLNNVIFIDTGKPNRKQILEQLWNGEPLISDEEAFERHLRRKWSKK